MKGPAGFRTSNPFPLPNPKPYPSGSKYASPRSQVPEKGFDDAETSVEKFVPKISALQNQAMESLNPEFGGKG